MTESQVASILRQRYPEDRYAFLTQVRSSTGYSSVTRTADAIVMGLWPSRGLHLEGFEIKVSRTDLQKELKSPAKAELIACYCDYWWLVVSDESIVRDIDEIPRQWGLMTVCKNKIVIIKAAEKLEPRPIDRSFLASLMRCIQDATKGAVPKSEIQSQLDQKFRDGIEQGKIELRNQEQLNSVRYQQLRASVDAFTERSGVRIDQFYGDHVGDLFALVQSLSRKRNLIDGVRDAANEIVKACDKFQQVTAVNQKGNAA